MKRLFTILSILVSLSTWAQKSKLGADTAAIYSIVSGPFNLDTLSAGNANKISIYRINDREEKFDTVKCWIEHFKVEDACFGGCIKRVIEPCAAIYRITKGMVSPPSDGTTTYTVLAYGDVRRLYKVLLNDKEFDTKKYFTLIKAEDLE